MLDKAVDGSSEAMAKLLKRKEANILATLLLGGQAKNYEKILGEMENAVGATDDAYRRQTEGINEQGHSWEKTKQRMVVFSQRLGDKLLPVLGRLLDKLEPVLEYIEKMDEETMDSWIAFGKWITILAVGTKALSGFLGVVEGIGTLRALTTGLKGVSGELVGIQGQAKATGAALTAMKVTGGLAALGLGLAIGKMLNDIWLAPSRARVAREHKEHTEKSFLARVNVARNGTLEEQQEELARLEKEKLPFETEFLSTAVSFLPGVESPQERRGRAIKERRRAKEALRRSITEKTTQRGFELEQEYGIDPQISMPGGSTGGQSIQTTNNITINASGVSAEEVVRVTKKEIKTAERNTLKSLRNSGRGLAPAEQ
jgi:hypothetical protein